MVAHVQYLYHGRCMYIQLYRILHITFSSSKKINRIRSKSFIFYMSATMPHITCMILLKSKYVMLFAIAFTSYYCYLLFFPLLYLLYGLYFMLFCIILFSFLCYLQAFLTVSSLASIVISSFWPFLFLGHFWAFLTSFLAFPIGASILSIVLNSFWPFYII